MDRQLYMWQAEQRKVYCNKRAMKKIDEDAESCLAWAYGALLIAEHQTDHISNVRVNEISNIRRKLGRFLDELKDARASTDDIVLSSRVSAELVLDRMYELLERFGSVTVADLRDLVGLPTTHLDAQWGWTKLYASQTHILQTSTGYLLDLPPTESLIE